MVGSLLGMTFAHACFFHLVGSLLMVRSVAAHGGGGIPSCSMGLDVQFCLLTAAWQRAGQPGRDFG